MGSKDREVEITTIYSKGLFQVAIKSSALERFISEASFFLEHLLDNKKFKIFLEAPHVSTEEKRAFIHQVLKNSFLIEIKNLLLLLVDKDRTKLLSKILLDFLRLVDEYQGTLAGEIRSATPLTDLELAQITASVEKRSSRKLHLTYKIEPSLIAGLIIQTEEFLIDQSVKGHLKKIAERLAGEA